MTEHLEPKSRIKRNQSEWKTVGIRVRNAELPLLNKQLDRLNYVTLGDLVRDLMSGKLTRLTDDQQIDIMKTNLQTNGQLTETMVSPMTSTTKLKLKIPKLVKLYQKQS